jgi:hypothetical protein
MTKTTVARIFSPQHVALSAGTEQGVKEGEVFVIYSLSDMILDPSNGESLGQLEIVKGRVRVFYVQEKMCQAETLTRTVKDVIDPMGLSRMSLLMQHEVTRKVQDELKVDHSLPISADLTVRVGDLARSVD